MTTSSSSEVHGRQALVGRQQDDLAVLAVEGLDGGLVARDAGHDDLAPLGGGLGPGDDEVAVEDARVDHRVPTDPQHEQVAVPGEVGGQGVDLFDVLLGQHIGAGGDVADQGDVTHRTPLVTARTGVRVVADLDGAGLGRVPVQVAPALQRGQVRVHGGGRGEAHGLADLPHRRRVAPLGGLGLDEVEDLALTVGQLLLLGRVLGCRHGRLLGAGDEQVFVTVAPRRGCDKHLFVCP